jgi:restriction system protein
MIYIAVALALIVAVGAVAVALVKFLGAVFEIIREVGGATAKDFGGVMGFLVDLIGRKHREHKASIPTPLEGPFNLWPEGDPEQVALREYDPQPVIVAAPAVETYQNTADILLRDPLPAYSSTVNIEELDQILWPSPYPSYERLFKVMARPVRYPVPPPAAPADPRQPPKWTARRRTFEIPSFNPPYYSPSLSWLNRFVDAVYAGELNRVNLAVARKANLEAELEQRDKVVEMLAGGALDRWKKAKARQVQSFAQVQAEYQKQSDNFIEALRDEQALVQTWHTAATQPGVTGLLCRIDLTMRTLSLPLFVSRECKTTFDPTSGIVIHEHRFPDLESISWLKKVKLKSSWSTKPLNIKEKREAAAKLWPSLCLRLASEIALIDTDHIVKAIAVNGWADYIEKATGQEKRAYCASLFALKNQIDGLNLSALDPVVAFQKLKGVASLTSLELTPIAPVIRLDTTDPRFVDPKDVLARMSEGENIAAMDWEDFEHLCRQLFERAFAESGAEVKVTQASRDQGVDAVVFDPDPIRGGKIVIQAKRYTNTVDVSAVRELYGAVINEGATKGILVTTSQYGPDAYAFAKDKPLTLMNGSELLGLLKQHGYTFRINLEEAKKMV